MDKDALMIGGALLLVMMMSSKKATAATGASRPAGSASAPIKNTNSNVDYWSTLVGQGYKGLGLAVELAKQGQAPSQNDYAQYLKESKIPVFQDYPDYTSAPDTIAGAGDYLNTADPLPVFEDYAYG